MKILVTGADGQLGADVVTELKRRKISCRGITRKDVDISDGPLTAELITSYAPDAVIHCAAYTNVENAQEDYMVCNAVNSGAVRTIAQTCRNIGAKMMYISTDYVFPGTGDKPYETDAKKGPLNEYGLSKLAGEEAVKSICTEYFIVRTSWVFSDHGKNFVSTISKAADAGKTLRIVDDQTGSPTYTPDLAVLLCDMIMTDKYGIYHATNEGYCSFYEFALEILKLKGCKVPVIPVKTSEYESKAKRPLNSRLSKKSLDDAGFSRLPSWQDALERYFKK